MAAIKMHHTETVKEVRMERHVTSSEGGRPPNANNNLSELDTLLQDLDHARTTGFYKDNAAMNGARPTVDSLLDELNSVERSETSGEQRQEAANRHELRIPTDSPLHRGQGAPPQASASTATRELDDLMASLSGFKVKDTDSPPAAGRTSQEGNTVPDFQKDRPPVTPGGTGVATKQEKLRSPALVRKFINSAVQSPPDNSYAKPQKPRTPPPREIPNKLDSMLGSLASHMTEQGITTTQKGCCCACEKPIVGQVITALGKTWHPEHFTCAHCNQELGTKNFFEREGKPYCEEDYHALFSPKCEYCQRPILDKCVTALDKTWHPDHFFCSQCGNTFGDEGFHEKDGKPYCREDYYNMFAPKCGGCNAPIMENYISALNSQWHPDCFVCRDCRQPFDGGSFFDHEGMPYCETHYHAKRGSLCAGCNKPITGRCITAMFRKFHPEHFVCSFCLKQLNKGTFKEQNSRPYCHLCFDKLFG